jgi:hypothetical protein
VAMLDQYDCPRYTGGTCEATASGRWARWDGTDTIVGHGHGLWRQSAAYDYR